MRLIPIVVLWLAVLRRLPSLRHGHVQRVLWLTLTALAVGATVDLPGLPAALDRALGTGPNTGHLLKHMAVLAAAAGAREVVRSFALPPDQAAAGVRQRLATFAAAQVALLALFTVAPVHASELPTLNAVADRPALLAYWAVFVVFLTGSLISVERLTRWYLGHADRGGLRTGFVLLELGALVGLLYCAHKVLHVAVQAQQLPLTPLTARADEVSDGLKGIAFLLLVLGVAWPQLAEQPLVRRLAAARADRALRPLWHELAAAVPGVALHRQVHDPHERLYDRVIEIRDSVLALRPYADERLLARTRRVAAELAVPLRHRDAAADAAWLELARRAKLRNEPAPAGGGRPPPVTLDLDDEVRTLLAISRQHAAGVRIADHLQAGPDRSSTGARQ